MKTGSRSILLVAFLAGMTAAFLWPVNQGFITKGASVGALDGRAEAALCGKTGRGSADAAASSSRTDSATVSGSRPVSDFIPTLDEVLAAKGIDRMLLMARFLQTATSAEMGGVIQRLASIDNYDSGLLAQIWERWVEIDREAAFHYADSDDAERFSGAFGPWTAWAKQNPQAALAAALKESPPDHLEAVVKGLAGSDPALARKIIAEHRDLGQCLAQDEILQGLAKHDPPAAMKAAWEIGSGIAWMELSKWLDRDPEAARAWMQGVTDPGERRLVESVASAELISSDPAGALLKATALPLGVEQTRTIVAAVGELARRDPESARGMAESMPNAYARSQALAALAGSLSTQDPDAARGLIPDIDWNLLKDEKPAEWHYTGPDGKPASGTPTNWSGNPESGKTTQNLLTKLMNSDPQRTAEAFTALPESSGAPISAAIGAWAGLQPEAASAWVRDLPGGPAKDSGIEGLATWLAKDSPEPDYAAALEWAESASPERQLGILQQTLAAWGQKDPAAARAAAAAETLPVTPEQRETLLQSLK